MAKKKIQEKIPPAKLKPLNTALWYKNPLQLGLVITVLAVTFVCFSPVLSSVKEFINFDDPVYITKQDLITKLDAKHLKTMFSQHDASLNYHPLTMLSLAINYSFSKLNPFGYFFTNLFIHLCNTFLVFLFLYRLSGKKFWTGLIAAALFGIHPMHVESVAWAAERKDVLYCFFFLASCIMYLSFLQTKKVKYLIFCFVLFLLSCISKAMAVPLPVVLLLIDFYKQRKVSIKTVSEKIPFFILSFVFGYIAVKVQSQGAISDLKLIPMSQRFFYASYGFIMYLFKLIVPRGLSAFYPYPILENGNMPFIYKVAPPIVLLILTVPLVISYKLSKTKFRVWFFGLGFFIAMAALVLQLISVGAAIMADRYSYLPYIGIFFITATYINELLEKRKLRIIVACSLIAAITALAAMCYARVQVWQNDLILWTNVIDQYPPLIKSENGVVHYTLPEGVSIAYDNRANYYRLHNEMDKAFEDYEVLAHFGQANGGIYNNLGNIYCMKAQEAAAKNNKDTVTAMYTKAIEMYSEAIKLQASDIDALHNRGITYSGMGEHGKALDDFKAALKLNPNDQSIVASIASEEVQLGMYEQGIEDYGKAIIMTPGDARLIFYRGTAYVNSGKYNEGIRDLSEAIKINPSMGECWYNLAFAFNKINNKQEALNAAQNAKKNGYPVTDQYLESLRGKVK